MPVMDGIAAAHAIRQGEGTESEIPIIALTAHALGEEQKRCQEAGMNGYLIKPFRAAELIALLERFFPLTDEQQAV